MATIVLHAGRPKTGSTSIQWWIRDNASRIREQHGIQTVVATRANWTRARDVRLEPYESGNVNSSHLILKWLIAKRPPEVPHRFVEDLARFSEAAPTVLFSAESLSQAIALEDEPFLLAFEELARDHDVRIAYYVRPQHTALEATWRQDGYAKQTLEPSDWVLQARHWLHYLSTLDAVRNLAPSVAFGMRPFLPDLLDGGSPVEDFARRFLSLDEEFTNPHRNPGDPLELVNLLRHAPEGWFKAEAGDVMRNPRRRLKNLLNGLEIRESPRIRRSRLILQQHCHEVFESENQELIRRLGWPVSYFVPPVEDLDGEWSLDELDDLWMPEASEAERALLYHALRAALA